MPPPRDRRASRGQAAVELVALLPALALLVLVCWWIVAGAHTWSQAGGAARAGARAAEVGAPVADGARSVLPAATARRARITEEGDRVSVRLAMPRPLPFLPSITVSAEATVAP